ncbi:MAG TPA: outer membrane protein assembly factor BamA [candidate division Zixibacteria bacterium]|nr:outer membrane protein assembly factor BamA [candidate division Zixibacteria bacterium]HEQ99556.1 outer membrane protein assembly factor BamA [candidate division Zixibacteria bacterium]
MKFSRLLFSLTLLLTVLFAAGLSAQNLTISSIEVEGNKLADKSLILSVSDFTIGSVLTSTATQDAVRQIYELGLFSDVQLLGEIQDGKYIDLIIKVEEYPVVTEVQYKGNDEISDKDLREIDSIRIGQMISPNQVLSSVKQIKAKYQEKGYYRVKIESELKEVTDDPLTNEHVLVFEIDEGPKIRIREIEFVGNEIFTDDKLRGKMGNKPKGFLRSGNFDPEKHEEDKEKIVRFYREEGYIDAAVLSDSVIIDENDPRWMTVQIEVYEGPRYYFGETSFYGHKVYGENALYDQLTYEEYDVYNPEKFEESIGQLYSLYQEQGYIHARIFENLTTVDSMINVEFEISEGVPAKINKIEIVGNTRTKEKVIRREMFSRPGQIFRRSLLERSVRNVMLLNYFESAIPDFRVLPNGDVDLVMEMKEKPTGQFNAGAGYSGQDGLVGTVSLGMPNFRGNGQNLSLAVEFGANRNSVSISFSEPWLFGTPTSFSSNIYNLNRRWYDDFWEGRRGGSIRFGRRLSWPDDYFRLYGGYRLEDVRYYDFEDTTSYPDLQALNEDWLRTSSVNMSIVRDSRDLPLFPTRGSVYRFTTEYAGGPLGGYYEFHRHTFEASKFIPLFWKFVLAGKMKVGVVDSPDGEDGVPFTERFSPGGTDPDGTIRGYDDGRVTPKNSLGQSIRGRAMLVYNAELQVPIVEQQIYALLFADAGNSWLAGYQISPFNKDELYKSYGAGFRIVVPGVGVIGFDFGYGINADDPGWKPHFQVGTTF